MTLRQRTGSALSRICASALSPLAPQSWNLYGYARNNPLHFVDPTGHDYDLYEYDMDGKVINIYRIRDITDLGKGRYKGYKVYGQAENGDLYVSGRRG